MKQEVADQVIAAIARAKRIPGEEISLDSTFEDLGVDSLDAIELLFDLEDKYEIAIPDDDAKALATVREVVDCLSTALAERTEDGRASED